MGKSFKWLFWTVLFLLMLLAIDQFFVQVPPIHPAHDAVSRFYKDFRHRLLAMTLGEKPPVKPPPIKMPAKPDTIETVIDKQVTAEKAKAKAKSAPQRYVYSDEQGNLQFAESLEDVPAQFREAAQPMGQ